MAQALPWRPPLGRAFHEKSGARDVPV